MSMIRAAGKSGGGAEDHELLGNRRGVGADGEAWHLSSEQYQRVINMQYYRGFFLNEEALKAAYPTDTQGAYAIVLSTGTFWFWEGLERGWVDTGEAVTQVVGLPPGGVTGQVLTKKSNADNDVEWADGGTGSGVHNDLAGLQGGVPGERYHITEAEAEVVDAWLRRAPTRPANISPEDAAVDVVERPLFVSTDYHNPFGHEFYGYQMQILNETGTTTVFDTGEIEATVPTYRLAAGVLQVNTNYQWRVRYQGGNLVWSSWSEATKFGTEEVWSSSVILQPQLIAPGNGTVLATAAPLLVLTPFDAGSGLSQGEGDFQVAQDPTFNTGVIAGKGLDSWQVDTILTRGTNYYARARHGDDTASPNQVLSAWSPRIGFAVRNLYRNTRIGIVQYDEGNHLFVRIDGNYNPVDLDANFWEWHPVWAMLKATQTQYIDGQNLSSVPKFWIYSDNVPYGPFAGKKCWMIDTSAPSAAELASGWHVHGAFKSDNYGEQDVLNISRGFAVLASNVISCIDGSMDGAGMAMSSAMNYAAARNTDQADPLKRGWHLTTWYEQELLKLLIQIDKIQIMDCYNLLYANGTYYEIRLGPFSSNTSGYWCAVGLQLLSAWPPGGSVSPLPITQRAWSQNAGDQDPTDFYRNSDGPEVMHMGDYLIGLVRKDEGRTRFPDSSLAVYITGSPKEQYHYAYPNRQPDSRFGWVGSSYSTYYSSGSTRFKLSKWV